MSELVIRLKSQANNESATEIIMSEYYVQIVPHRYNRILEKCSNCNGNGRISCKDDSFTAAYYYDVACPACNGKGYLETDLSCYYKS